MRNRLDEDYFMALGKIAIIVACTAIACAVVWTSPFMLWVLALLAEQTGIKF